MKEIEINGVLYRVEPLQPHPGVAARAVRLWRENRPDPIDIWVDQWGLSCDCESFIARCEGTGNVCKHIAAVLKGGFLGRKPYDKASQGEL